ncbi:MAG TPA: hypothetical protein VGG01_13500 [Xanthobacteraceae bacterium]|jgi:hypothetical protein
MAKGEPQHIGVTVEIKDRLMALPAPSIRETVVWVLVYYGAMLGHPPSATIGMRAMQLATRT